MTFSPASNLRSNVLAFINLHFLIARPSYRNDSHVVIAPRYHRGPVFLEHLSDYHPMRLVTNPRRKFQQCWIRPKCLSLVEIDAMLALVLGALFGVVLKAHRALLSHQNGILKV